MYNILAAIESDTRSATLQLYYIVPHCLSFRPVDSNRIVNASTPGNLVTTMGNVCCPEEDSKDNVRSR